MKSHGILRTFLVKQERGTNRYVYAKILQTYCKHSAKTVQREREREVYLKRVMFLKFTSDKMWSLLNRVNDLNIFQRVQKYCKDSAKIVQWERERHRRTFEYPSLSVTGWVSDRDFALCNGGGALTVVGPLQRPRHCSEMKEAF